MVSLLVSVCSTDALASLIVSEGRQHAPDAADGSREARYDFAARNRTLPLYNRESRAASLADSGREAPWNPETQTQLGTLAGVGSSGSQPREPYLDAQVSEEAEAKVL